MSQSEPKVKLKAKTPPAEQLEHKLRLKTKRPAEAHMIPIKAQHHCNEACRTDFKGGLNPDYDPITGQCDRMGQIDDVPPHIASSCDEMWKDYCEQGTFLDANEIVIQDRDIQIEFDYPLKDRVSFSYHSPTGFTRKQLVDHIRTAYENIYELEAQTTTVPIGRMKGYCNRNETNGLFGISMHILGDLYLEQLDYEPRTKKVFMLIGS